MYTRENLLEGKIGVIHSQKKSDEQDLPYQMLAYLKTVIIKTCGTSMWMMKRLTKLNKSLEIDQNT